MWAARPLGHARAMTPIALRTDVLTTADETPAAPPRPLGPAATAAGPTGPTPASPTPTALRRRTARAAAHVALALGLASAAVSLAWALGSTWLLDTVGGSIEQLALGRTPLALAVIAATVAVKVVAALLPVWAVRDGGDAVYPSARRKVVRALAWAEALVLTLYGTVMAVGGALVGVGVIEAAADADLRAIAWHAAVWDPWFAAWGLAALVALVASRDRGRAGRVRAGSPVGRTGGRRADHPIV